MTSSQRILGLAGLAFLLGGEEQQELSVPFRVEAGGAPTAAESDPEYNDPLRKAEEEIQVAHEEYQAMEERSSDFWEELRPFMPELSTHGHLWVYLHKPMS